MTTVFDGVFRETPNPLRGITVGEPLASLAVQSHKQLGQFRICMPFLCRGEGHLHSLAAEMQGAAAANG